MKETTDDPYPSPFSPVGRCSAWQLLKFYWQSNDRFPAYLFFSIIFILTVSFVSMDVVFNYWYYYFYEVVQAYDKHGIARVLAVFSMLTAFYVLFAGYRYFMEQTFGGRWRRWLLQRCSTFINKTQCATQSTSDEVSTLLNYSIDLSMALISVITSFWVMMYVLWLMSSDAVVTFGSWKTLALPGYLMWLGVAYASIGVFLALRSRHKQSKLNQVIGHLPKLLPKKPLSIFSNGIYQLSVILPLLVVLPGYFDQIFMLSWLLQTMQAFGRVQGKLSFIVNSYSSSVGVEH